MPRTTEDLQDFCRTLAGTTEDVKWGHHLVFSVGGKMFAIFDLPDNGKIRFKVEPLLFSSLVEQDGIEPSPYLARQHWVFLEDRKALPTETLKDLLSDAHALVAAKLSKKKQRELGLLDE